MAKRPALFAGDVCRPSRRGRHNYRFLGRNMTLVVLGVSKKSLYQDTSDGRCLLDVTHTVTRHSKTRSDKLCIMRRDMWFTRYNVNDKQPVSAGGSLSSPTQTTKIRRTDGSPKNNDGQTHCFRCGKPVVAQAGYQICKNKGCCWFDN